MPNASGLNVRVFSRLYTIMETILAGNAFATSACRDTMDTILIAAAPPVAAISIAIAACEPEQLLRSHGV